MAKYTFLNKWHRNTFRKINELSHFWKCNVYKFKNYSKIYDSTEFTQDLSDVNGIFKILTDVNFATRIYFFYKHKNWNCTYPEGFLDLIHNPFEEWPELHKDDITPVRHMLNLVDLAKTAVIRLQSKSQELHMPYRDLYLYTQLFTLLYALEGNMFALSFYTIRQTRKGIITYERREKRHPKSPFEEDLEKLCRGEEIDV